MLFPELFIENLKQRLPISKVIGNRIKLQKNGPHYKGLCPFHQEKTPSFTVQDQKGSYYCFGCHAHGDIIQFISEVDHLSFVDTVTYLANLAGVSLPKLSPVEQKKVERQHSLIDVTTKASEWFYKQLRLSSNHAAYEYLQTRGINDQDIQTFSLGYAPSKGLLTFLRSVGFSNDLVVEAGLAIKSDKGDYIERFRNRIIFPIKNHKNQVVGFGGRSLDPEVMPKYLNSPETPLFKKNNLLYAADIARKHSFKNERLIVVEGYMDAIFMHKAGIFETVAALGTAFNQTHLKNLWALADEPILCFDGDSAGKKAMLKAAHVALPLLSPGVSLKFCLLPKGQDPDEVINTYGVDYISKLLGDSISLSDFIWQSELSQSKSDSPEAKALFEQRINDLVVQIQNPIVRNYYNKYVKDKLWENYFRITKKKEVVQSNYSSVPIVSNLSTKERLEYSLFAQLVTYPSLIEDKVVFEHLSHFEIDNQELDNLRSILIDFHENQKKCLNDLLIDNNLIKLVTFICGPKSSFIDIISKFDIITAKEIWFITYKKYLLELLKVEYNQWMRKIHDDNLAFEKAGELKKSIDILTEEIIEKENELSPE